MILSPIWTAVRALVTARKFIAISSLYRRRRWRFAFRSTPIVIVLLRGDAVGKICFHETSSRMPLIFLKH